MEQNTQPGEPDEATEAAAERQTLFTDAVVAIAITLLALELPIPEGSTNHALLESAWHDRYEYFAYGLSFIVIAAHWSSHHRVFRHVRSFGSRVGQLNLLWLFMQVTTPFATKVISGHGAAGVRFGFYALIQGLSSLILMLIIRQLRVEGSLRPGSDPDALRRIAHGLLVTALAFLVSVPVFFLTSHAWVIWLTIRPVNRLRRLFSGRNAVSRAGTGPGSHR